MSNKKKKAKLKALREEKRSKNPRRRKTSYSGNFHSPGFDFVAWNRSLKVARPEGVEEKTVSVDMDDAIVDWTSMDMKPVATPTRVNGEKMKKVGKLLNKVGI